LLVLAEITQSLPLVLLSAAAGGIAGGLGYRGSLEVINRIAPADRRSEVVSNRWQFGGGHRHRIALGHDRFGLRSHHLCRRDHRARGHRDADRDQIRAERKVRHLIASGLVGEPTAPVIGIAGATNMNS